MLKICRRIVPVLLVLSSCLWIAGCSSPVNVAEVLQQPKQRAIITRCNLWYDEHRRINAMNYQSGKFLPLGTSVIITQATANKIVFTAGGAEYRIDFRPEWLMIPVQEYIRQVFSVRTRAELTKGIAPKVLDEIERGRVVKGMTRAEVLLCCGHPPACRTTSLNNDTWVYWTSPMDTIRVVFKNDKVTEILSL